MQQKQANETETQICNGKSRFSDSFFSVFYRIFNLCEKNKSFKGRHVGARAKGPLGLGRAWGRMGPGNTYFVDSNTCETAIRLIRRNEALRALYSSFFFVELVDLKAL